MPTMPNSSKILRALTAAACTGAAIAALLSGCAGTATRPPATPDDDSPATAHAVAEISPRAAAATRRLVAGNVRFVWDHMQHPRQTPDSRSGLTNLQQPFAIIVSCSDSRVGPEIVFDQGLGDLFVARVAGNVIDDHVVGSLEYALEHLHVPLIVVLGHEYCGAVTAARDTIAAHGHPEGHIGSLVEAIRPAVEATLGEDAEDTCKANVRNVVAGLRSSEPILKAMVDSGEVEVVGAYYDLDTGGVTFLGDS